MLVKTILAKTLTVTILYYLFRTDIFSISKLKSDKKENDFFARFVYYCIITIFNTSKLKSGKKKREIDFFPYLFTSIL